ncbi:flotillin-like protein 3, partial [Tanacetum coccineum]
MLTSRSLRKHGFFLANPLENSTSLRSTTLLKFKAEKLPFILPVVFTIGPQEDKDSLYKYAKLTTCKEKDESHMQELVKGIIEGETRVLAASMTMEEIFRGTKEFKKEVFDK